MKNRNCTSENPDKIILKWAETFGPQWRDLISLDTEYHLELPDELNKWHVFVMDSGHSILCLLETFIHTVQENKYEDYLLPVPVKSVLRNYRIENNIVIVNLQYDKKFGLIGYEDDDFEY
jgi:hypothetical protein